MQEKIKKHIFPLLILFILSLVPFLWLRNDSIILGHDAGTPLSPIEHFEDRLEMWTYRYGGGSDQTFAVAGFFLHGFEYLLGQLSLSLSNQQAIQFSTYFFLIGISMYVSSQYIFRKIQPEFALIAAIIYEFNHFILQAWFIAERTKFSVYIVLPLLSALILMVFRKEIKPHYAGLLSGLLLTVLNGGGFLPLYASLFLAIGTISLSVLLFLKPVKEKLIELFIYFCSFVGTYLLCNMYWLIPYYWYLQASFSTLVGEAGGLSGILNWVSSISENTSFLNLLRLQGIQEWYVNPEHPYAAHYFSNPLLILFSFLPMTVIALTFVRFRYKKHFVTAVLLLILLISLFLMAGSHKPFGYIYVLLLKYVPGFLAFRTPYYKFAPAFFLAFSLLTSHLLFDIFSNHKYKKLIIAVTLVAYLGYNFPFFSVNFFQYTRDRSTKVSVPAYVYEYAEYIKTNPDNLVRTVLYPGLNLKDATSQYDWGYWSLAPLHSLLDTHQYVLPTSGGTLETELIEEFYDALSQNNPDWLSIANNLGVDSILIEEDFNQLNKFEIHPKKLNESLKQNQNLTLLNDFGKWKIYKINYPQQIHPNYVQINLPIGRLDETDHLHALLTKQLEVQTPFIYAKEKYDSLNRLGTLLKATCLDCQIRREQTFIANRNVIFIPGSKVSFIANLLGIDYHHGDIPTDSLQKLYILQALVQRKEPSVLRIPIWHEYLADLNQYEKIIESDITLDKNDYQSSINNFSNILYQKNGIKDMSLYVNTSDEAALYIQGIEKIQQIEQKILLKNNMTVTSNKYKLAITPLESGEYRIFINNTYLNAVLTKQPIDIKIDDNTFKTTLAADSEWTDIGVQNLENKEYIIDIEDSDFKVSENVQSSVKIGNDVPCSKITKEMLPKGLYSIDMSLLSQETNANVTIHILKDGEIKPLMPYWGLPVELPQNVTINSLNAFDVEEEKEVTILMCAFTLKTPAEIKIQSFDLNRQTNPVFFLYKNDQQSIPAVGTFTIQREKNTRNEYAISSSSSGILNTMHPFNKNWKVSGNDDITQLKINDSIEAMIVPPGQYSLSEKYDNQKYFSLGSIISIIAGTIISGYLVLALKRSNK